MKKIPQDIAGFQGSRLDLAFGKRFLFRSYLGGKLSYRKLVSAPDRWSGDWGLLIQPGSFLRVGYYSENLWGRDELDPDTLEHRIGLGVNPLTFLSGFPARLLLGYEIGTDALARPEQWEGEAFAFIPLVRGSWVRAGWDAAADKASLGLHLQLSPVSRVEYRRLGASSGNIFHTVGLQGHAWTVHPALPRRSQGRAALVAVLDLNHTISEGVADRSWFSRPEPTLADFQERFHALEADPAIKAVVVKTGRTRCGWGIGEELRRRILRLRSRGVKVVAYMEQVSPLNYYIASAAEAIAMQPAAFFNVFGLSSETTFYRGLLDKLGVEAQFVRHGKYKSFDEVYTRESMSPEWRENTENLLGSMWNHFLTGISEARGITRASLDVLVDSADISLQKALDGNLIDTMLYEDQLIEFAGGKGARPVRPVPQNLQPDTWKVPAEIAVIVIRGGIISGKSTRGWLIPGEWSGSETVAAQLRRARRSAEVRAVILRIDSPGGSAQASDVIWREVELLKKAGKPVIASLGNTAASGGYYVICGADAIFTEPNSVVGSIGILAGKFVLRDTYHKVGITKEVVKTGEHADAQSQARPWTEEEKAALQNHMDEFYRSFVEKVAEGRGMSFAGADSVAQGRIFTGNQAVAVGLADRLGGLEMAVEEARLRAGIGTDRRVELVYFDGVSDVWASRGVPGLAFPGIAAPAPLSHLPSHPQLQSSRKGWKGAIGPEPEALMETRIWAFSPEAWEWSSFRF